MDFSIVIKINTTKKKIKKTYVIFFENKFGNDLEASGGLLWLCYVITDHRQAKWLCYVITDYHQINQINLWLCNVIILHNQIRKK
jgi:hypothetical protein